MSDDIIVDDLEAVISKAKDKKQNKNETATDEYAYTTVELPSNGSLGYPSEVEYRDILVKDEKMLASSTERTFPRILGNVLKNLLKDNSFFDKMTIHDRDFLLLWIWANNYSTIKDIEMRCPHCGHHNNYKIDLTKLDIDELDKDLKNPYPFKTKAGEKVSFRLLTVEDENIARKFCTNNKDYEEDFVLLCLSINFKMVMSLKDRINHIEEKFTGKDMSVLRGFHKHFKYGLNDVVDKECTNCGEVNKIAVPFQIDFFIPALSGDFD